MIFFEGINELVIKLVDNIFDRFDSAQTNLELMISNFDNELKKTDNLIDKLRFASNIYSSVDDMKLSKEIDNLIEKVETNKEEGSLYSDKVKTDIYENITSLNKQSKNLGENLISLKDSSFNKEEVSVPSENINCLKNEIIDLLENKSLSLEDVNEIFSKAEEGESIYKLIKSFDKVVQETSNKLGKKVQMGIEGNDLLIKPDTAKCLRESLIHIVRNSVDHGIENPDVQKSNRK